MDYRDCLRMAGADVHEYQEFGSYQGDWWAKVTFNGVTGWVRGSYGSCSGCDALQAALDYGHDHDDDYVSSYDSEKWTPETCAMCAKNVQAMTDIGRNDLDGILTQEQAEAVASEDIDWDMDAREALEFLRAHAI